MSNTIVKAAKNMRMFMEDIPDATIDITPNGELRFIYPTISADGKLYTLNVVASKK